MWFVAHRVRIGDRTSVGKRHGACAKPNSGLLSTYTFICYVVIVLEHSLVSYM